MKNMVLALVLWLGLAAGLASAQEQPSRGPSTDPEVQGEALLKQAEADFRAGKFTEAQLTLAQIPAAFSKKAEADRLAEEIAAAEAEAMTKAEVERRRKLFHGMVPKKRVTIGDVVVSDVSVTAGSSWMTDRHGGTRERLEADKGKTFIQVEFSVASAKPDAVLPPIAAYYSEGGDAYSLGGFLTAFARWSSEEAWLGAADDPANALGGKAPVKLSAALQVPKGELDKHAIIVVVAKIPCLVRRTRVEASPPVFYEAKNCLLPSVAAPDQLLEDNEVIGILNRGRL
jgi:hypothetical protein